MWPRSNLHSRPEISGDPYHQDATGRSVDGDAGAAVARSRDRLQHPAPHGFVGDVESAFGQQFFDIAVAQCKAEIEPDRVLDDLGRER